MEQDVRKKIVNIIARLDDVCRTRAVCASCKYSNYDNCTTHAIADEIIAEVIGDISTCKYENKVLRDTLKGNELDIMYYKRRADLAERQVKILATWLSAECKEPKYTAKAWEYTAYLKAEMKAQEN